MRILSVAVLAASLSSTAFAADLDYAPLRGTQYGSAPSQSNLWDGTYVGGFAGYTQSNYNFTGTTANLLHPHFRNSNLETEHQVSRLLEPGSADGNSMSFGAFAGYNVQMDEVVFGIELDYTRSRRKLTGEGVDQIGRSFETKDSYINNVSLRGGASAEMQEFGTLRGRVGYTTGAFLPFASFGLALGQAKVNRWVTANWSGYDSDPTAAPVLMPFNYPTYRAENARTAWSLGLAAGLGVDIALSQNAFLRTEWQFVRFTDLAGVAASVNTLRAGAGLKF
jgi:opacity protein-like surface antigen